MVIGFWFDEMCDMEEDSGDDMEEDSGDDVAVFLDHVPDDLGSLPWGFGFHGIEVVSLVTGGEAGDLVQVHVCISPSRY